MKEWRCRESDDLCGWVCAVLRVYRGELVSGRSEIEQKKNERMLFFYVFASPRLTVLSKGGKREDNKQEKKIGKQFRKKKNTLKKGWHS